MNPNTLHYRIFFKFTREIFMEKSEFSEAKEEIHPNIFKFKVRKNTAEKTFIGLY